jgi:hypothetical protein
VAVLGCVGFVGLSGVWAFKALGTDYPAAQAASNQFIEHIRQGRMEQAYGSTSTAFRAEQSAEHFQQFVQKFETFQKSTHHVVNSGQVMVFNGVKQAIFQITLHAPNNAMTCTLVLVEEGGAWKVQSITVPFP